MKESIVRKSVFLIVSLGAIIFQISPLKEDALSMGSNQEPTAVVLDAETGKPIEGAVAIAIWRGENKDGPWFEGGSQVAVRIEEAISDSEGKIYIDDFWDWHLLELSYPRLTIYKPGNVCWDQKSIYIDQFHSQERKDFDKKNRIVRMEKWPKVFSFVDHRDFMDFVTQRESLKAKQGLFIKAFEYELPYRLVEREKEDEKIQIKKMNKARRKK
jgi:hypothetical protein